MSTAESPIVLFGDSHLCELILWSDVESVGCSCKCLTIVDACYQQWQIIFVSCDVTVFPCQRDQMAMMSPECWTHMTGVLHQFVDEKQLFCLLNGGGSSELCNSKCCSQYSNWICTVLIILTAVCWVIYAFTVWWKTLWALCPGLIWPLNWWLGDAVVYYILNGFRLI